MVLGSCNNETPGAKQITIGKRDVEVYTFDGCEYIGYLHAANADFLTHKGNCNNPIHKQ